MILCSYSYRNKALYIPGNSYPFLQWHCIHTCTHNYYICQGNCTTLWALTCFQFHSLLPLLHFYTHVNIKEIPPIPVGIFNHFTNFLSILEITATKFLKSLRIHLLITFAILYHSLSFS